MLNLLEGFNLRRMGAGSANALHVWAEVQKMADEDADPLTDPAFDPVPVERLTSPAFANERRKLIDLAAAQTYSPGIYSGRPEGLDRSRHRPTDGHTAHASAIDRHGNAAAVTCTLGGHFGSGVVAEGTGVVLGNGLRSPWPPGHPNETRGNMFRATAAAPTIVVKDDVPILVTGAAGDASIYRQVVGIVSNVLDFGMGIGQAVDAERFHAYQDAEGSFAFVEHARIAPDVMAEVERRGHAIVGKLGEYACCPPLVGIAAAAGIDPRSGEREAPPTCAAWKTTPRSDSELIRPTGAPAGVETAESGT